MRTIAYVNGQPYPMRNEPEVCKWAKMGDDREHVDRGAEDLGADARVCAGQRGGRVSVRGSGIRYGFIRRTLVQTGYHGLGKGDKGVVRAYMGKVTGYSRGIEGNYS